MTKGKIAALVVALLLTLSSVSLAEAPADALGTVNGEKVPLADAQIEFSYYAAIY